MHLHPTHLLCRQPCWACVVRPCSLVLHSRLYPVLYLQTPFTRHQSRWPRSQASNIGLWAPHLPSLTFPNKRKKRILVARVYSFTQRLRQTSAERMGFTPPRAEKEVANNGCRTAIPDLPETLVACSRREKRASQGCGLLAVTSCSQLLHAVC